MSVEGYLDPRGGRADEGPSTACFGSGDGWRGEGGREDELTAPPWPPSLTGAPLPRICAFRLRQGAHARHGCSVHTAPEGYRGWGRERGSRRQTRPFHSRELGRRPEPRVPHARLRAAALPPSRASARFGSWQQSFPWPTRPGQQPRGNALRTPPHPTPPKGKVLDAI